MLEALSVRPHICEQIRSGPLGHWVDDFVDVLSTRGYATSTMRRYVRAAAIFSAWLDQQRVAATDIDETLVTRFVTGLPRRPAATRPIGLLSDVASGVRLLAVHLWTRDVAVRRSLGPTRSETQEWLQRFDDHLVQVHGLVAGTRQIYRRYAAALLAECAGTPTLDWSRLTVLMIAAFVQTRASQLRPSACRAPVTATRAFLRFLTTCGVVPAGIEGAVPTLREWKHASLPRALAAEDVQRVLAAVDGLQVERSAAGKELPNLVQGLQALGVELHDHPPMIRDPAPFRLISRWNQSSLQAHFSLDKAAG